MRYIGGKNHSGTFPRIIGLMPPHRIYVEGFLGSGAVLRHKRPAEQSIGIDVKATALALCDRAAPNLTLLQESFLEWFPRQEFGDDVLVYLDPPYLLSTRGGRRYYGEAELSDAEHARLLAMVRNTAARVMLSGYASALYDDALAGWSREEFTVYTRSHQPRTEVLWMNYERPQQPHDLRYVGANHRERWRLEKMRMRWVARLSKMPPGERAAIYEAMQEAMGQGGVSGS